jgi:hypothetical protein
MTENTDKPKTPKATTPDEWVYFLLPSEETDEKLANAWKKKHLADHPDSKAKFVSEIKLQRLTERHIVIPLYVPATEATTKEITAGTGVRVADHWLAEGEDGRVNTRTFLRQLNKGCLPAMIKARRDTDEDLGSITLRYA